MANLQDIFNLAKADGGKFFVMDESGEPKLVIMDIEAYQALLFGKIKNELDDVEKINREILRAQIEEQTLVKPIAPQVSSQTNHHVAIDMREEVIDPSFDFEGPKVDIEDL